MRAWEPPHRFVYEEAGWSGEAPPLATEIPDVLGLETVSAWIDGLN